MKQTKIAEQRLNKEIETLNMPFAKSGYSKAQMGSLEYRKIIAQIRNLQQLDKKKGKEFIKLKDRIKELGSLNYEMVQATIYRENFMKAIEYSKNLEGYDLLMKKLRRIQNPINFFNFIQKSDSFSDIFLYYKPR